MGAISNSTWKQAAMQKAEHLTDIWDIIKAWAGRSAEIVLTVCMFISLVGVLPGVHYWVWFSNLILAIQMIMLDFGGFALHTLAEHARDNGQEEAAQQAEKMATFLIRLVIASMAIITVGQLSAIFGTYAATIQKIVDYTEPALILVRVISSVKYIHTIHSLRGSTHLAIQPTHSPTQPVLDDRIDLLEETIKKLTEQLQQAQQSSLPTQLSTQPTQVVEVPTHDLHSQIKPLRLGNNQSHNGLHLLTMVAGSVGEDQDEQDREQEATTIESSIEAPVDHEQAIIYPVVPGVSAEKVKQLIRLYESGTKWRDLPGNYSQTIRPVKAAYESLHTPTQASIQNV